MPIVANTSLNSRTDMIAAIRAMQEDLGRPVCAAIDDQAIGQQIVILQKYLSTIPDANQASGFRFDPAMVCSNIVDYSLPGAIIQLQTAVVSGEQPPPDPVGFAYLYGVDGQSLQGFDGNYIYGRA